MLTILAQPLFKLLSWIYSFVGNWGWTIIIVTFLIKLVFYKLSETSGRSMAKMKTIAPRLKTLQERFKDDRQAQAAAMMELYKKEKINPVAGCLPILVQIPFFLAFYWVLLESVEMRQAPFMGWIQDLSSRDPYFVLPVLMGVAMFAQYKLNPTPPDPVQAKVFAFMPVIMTFMFMWFPAGLVLYWLTNTVLSIAQQWKINRVVEAEAKKQRKLTASGMEIIRTEGLSRHYAMGDATIHALRGIDLVVHRGEYVAIMGPSGCGKSTLMNLLGCLDTADAGRYWLGGRVVSELSELELSQVRNREIGFVFQAFALLPRQSAWLTSRCRSSMRASAEPSGTAVRGKRSSGWGSATVPAIARPSFPAASASASPSRSSCASTHARRRTSSTRRRRNWTLRGSASGRR